MLMYRPEAKSDKSTPFVPFKHILVPLDGSELATGVIETALALASCCEARISLLRIVEPIQLLTTETAIPFAFPLPVDDDISTKRLAERAGRELTQVAHSLSGRVIGEVDPHVIVARDVGQAIVDFALASAVDAIAMSTHGRGASRLLVGSVADKVIRSAALPMLLQGPAKHGAALDVVDTSSSARRESALST